MSGHFCWRVQYFICSGNKLINADLTVNLVCCSAALTPHSATTENWVKRQTQNSILTLHLCALFPFFLFQFLYVGVCFQIDFSLTTLGFGPRGGSLRYLSANDHLEGKIIIILVWVKSTLIIFKSLKLISLFAFGIQKNHALNHLKSTILLCGQNRLIKVASYLTQGTHQRELGLPIYYCRDGRCDRTAGMSITY